MDNSISINKTNPIYFRFPMQNNGNDLKLSSSENAIQLSGYNVGGAILARNNITFRNLATPIEVTDKYNKKIEGKDHLDLPNIHVYEYPDTNLQVIVNEIPNITNKNKFQMSFSLFNSGIKNDSVTKKNLLMELMKLSFNRNNINANLNEDFDTFLNIDININTSEIKKINILNKIITQPKFPKQDLEKCKKILIATINSEKYQKETAEFRKLAGDSLLNSKEETIKNIQNTTLSDIYSYYSEILKNTEAQYTVTIGKSFIDDNKNLFYSTLNSGMYNEFQKQSDKVLSSLEPITNKENLRFYDNDNDNDAYITFHYPVKIDSDRERLIYRYLTLLEIFWRAPYVSEDSGGKKYSLPMELNSKDISPNKYGFLEFKFVPKGNEKIDSTDDAIEVFKAVLGILYGEKLAPNTLESIKDYEKELYNERLNKNFDDKRTHEILKNYRKDVFKIYELIDDIDFEDIKRTIEYILFEQNPIVIINEKINPYEVKGQTVDNNIINC